MILNNNLIQIKIWILTGDKKETAINIGYATNIIGVNDKIVMLDLEEHDDHSKLEEIAMDQLDSA